MKKTIILGTSIVALALIVVGVGGNLRAASAAEGAMSPAFTDTNGHWAKSYIDRIAEKGIVQGKSRNRYAPDDNISRAELLKIAIEAFGQEVDAEVTEDVLSDVKVDDWFAPYVRAAFRHKIIYGFNEGFGPNTPATRGMAVTILVKAAGFEDVDAHFSENYSGMADLKTANFTDVPVEAYYAPFIAYLYDMQIIDGYEDGTFGPSKPITRAEIAKIVVNLLDEDAPAEESESVSMVTEPEVVEPEVVEPEVVEPEAISEQGDREISGTYYRISSRGSAIYFRTENEPDKEVHLQNAELFLNDKQLYKDLGLEEIYEVKDPGCSSFWGKATIQVTDPQFPDEDNSSVGFLKLIEKDEPTCGPSEYQMEDHSVFEHCGTFPKREMSYDPSDIEYEVCYGEAFETITEDGCYLMDLRPIEDPYYTFAFKTYSLAGEELSSSGQSTDNITIEYDDCLPITEEYFNSIVE